MALVLLLSGPFLYDAPIHARSSVPHRSCAEFPPPCHGRQAAFHTSSLFHRGRRMPGGLRV